MKKITALYILVFIISGLLWHCDHKKPEPISYEKQLILVNPDLGDLTSIISMVDEEIIELSNTELLAVHHVNIKNRYESNIQFLSENIVPYVSVEQIEGDLNEENLFSENPCSKAFRRLFRDSDGILFFGGPDFPATIYGQKTNLLTAIRTPNRHYFELSFLYHLLGGNQDPDYNPLLEKNPDYVVYGFCLGMQSINVATGGTMYQDIPSEVYGLNYVEDILKMDSNAKHRNYWNNLAPRENLNWCNFHKIQFTPGSIFSEKMSIAVNLTPYVCSSHHQAAKDLGKDLVVAARSMDGKIIEALTHKRFENVLGVQFHPEAFSIYSSEARKFKQSPSDTVLISENDFLKQDGSLEFHRAFWSYFSKIFNENN
jgi:putative glutamine amidotransferase